MEEEDAGGWGSSGSSWDSVVLNPSTRAPDDSRDALDLQKQGMEDTSELCSDPNQVEVTDEDPFGEAGQLCNICASETRINTHFAVPCRHAACEQCWETWLRQQASCMMCAQRVRTIKRFAHSIVPPQPHEAPGPPESPLYAINSELETAVAGVLASLVSIKARLGELDGHLEEMQSHLKGGIWNMSSETRNSVASVEMSALSEHLEALSHILRAPGERSLALDTPPFVLLNSRIDALLAVLTSLGHALDEHHTLACERQQQEPQQESGTDGNEERAGPSTRVRPLAGLDISLLILKDCKGSVLRAQWHPAKQMLVRMTRTVVPAILEAIQMQGAMEASSAVETRHLQRRVDRLLPQVTAALEALLPEVDLMLIRVQSCFDCDDS